ncbi:MAG: hypothetical protein IMY72_09790 [Bacteroidetes bacterium]|nr:hypothetical protein [Bacteroidota bacterium]
MSNSKPLLGQNKKGYEYLTTIKAPNFINNSPNKENKNSIVRAMILSKSNKYFITIYGNKSSILAFYEIGSFKKICSLRLTGVLELNNSYFGSNDSIFYLKCERYSSEYKKINIFTSRYRKINCNKTPRGCRVEEVRLNKIRFYTNDKKYFISRSKKNRNDIFIYEKYE